MRFRLTIEYDGEPFCGWQRQDNGASVQGALEEAIFKLSGETVTVTGAGRTDSGVHALGQVAHFDLEKELAPSKVRDALNHHLKPAPVAVLNAAIAAPEFHARFSAKARHYLYRIVCRRAPLVLARGRAWHVMGELDSDAMHAAAQSLIGAHDFTTFRASECQAKSPMKTLDVSMCAVSPARSSNGIGAFVPASPGALDGGFSQAGGRGQMAGARYGKRVGSQASLGLRPCRTGGRSLSRGRGLLKIDQFDIARIDGVSQEYLAHARKAVRRIRRQELS